MLAKAECFILIATAWKGGGKDLLTFGLNNLLS